MTKHELHHKLARALHDDAMRERELSGHAREACEYDDCPYRHVYDDMADGMLTNVRKMHDVSRLTDLPVEEVVDALR